MAQSTVFKTFLNSDVTTTKTLLHEAIPITGSLVSGTYGLDTVAGYGNEPHIKKYSHGMFQSVYDYPYLSSSANHIFDISTGVAPYVPFSGSGGAADFQGAYTSSAQLPSAIKTQQSKKKNLYIQMAQVLTGYDHTGSIRLFDRDGDFGSLGDKILDPVFFTFSRLLVKDEIKKGSFSMKFGTDSSFALPFTRVINIADTDANNSYRVNSPAGEYGILYATDGGSGTTAITTGLGAATLTCADGDDNTNGQFTEGEHIILTSTDNTTRVYVLVDGSEAGAPATGIVIESGDDTGAATLSGVTAALGTCIAVQSNLNTHNQATVLNEFRAAILSTTGHDGKITCSAALTPAHGVQTITLTQATVGIAGNTAITTTISQITAVDFTSGAELDTKVGLLYYQAGVAVLDGSKIFKMGGQPDTVGGDAVLDQDGLLANANPAFHYTSDLGISADGNHHTHVFVSGTIDDMANAVRHRLVDISFNNTTELNSAVYFCRAHHNEFNYSSNPTYLSSSQIRVKKNIQDPPRSYVTTIGMYSTDNELLAVAKLSEPIRKDPTNEVTLRVRLDY